MNSKKKAVFQDSGINVKIILSALWIVIMFLFIYVDYFALYQPGSLEEIMSGKVFIFDITEGWLASAMTLMTIPIVMIFLSLVLKARANRLANIIVGLLYIAVVIANVVGESTIYLIMATVVELVFLFLIVKYAWKWPRNEES